METNAKVFMMNIEKDINEFILTEGLDSNTAIYLKFKLKACMDADALYNYLDKLEEGKALYYQSKSFIDGISQKIHNMLADDTISEVLSTHLDFAVSEIAHMIFVREADKKKVYQHIVLEVKQFKTLYMN